MLVRPLCRAIHLCTQTLTPASCDHLHRIERECLIGSDCVGMIEVEVCAWLSVCECMKTFLKFISQKSSAKYCRCFQNSKTKVITFSDGLHTILWSRCWSYLPREANDVSFSRPCVIPCMDISTLINVTSSQTNKSINNISLVLMNFTLTTFWMSPWYDIFTSGFIMTIKTIQDLCLNP